MGCYFKSSRNRSFAIVDVCIAVHNLYFFIRIPSIFLPYKSLTNKILETPAMPCVISLTSLFFLDGTG